jgi:glycerate dehydrogenase
MLQPSHKLSLSVSVINANRIDFDRKINWSSLGSHVSIHNDEVGLNPTNEEIWRRSNNCEVIITKEIPFDDHVVMNLPASVKLICEAGTGYNNIDLNACRIRDIKVANIPNYSEGAVASLVITFILTLSCGLIAEQKELWGGNLSTFQKGIPSKEHVEVEGKVLGLIGGTGNIGQRVANIALSLGMKILISSRRLSPDSQREGVEYTDSVDYLISRSDFISIHCPLNEEVRENG